MKINGKITIEAVDPMDYDGYLRIHIPEQAIVFRGSVDKYTLETTILKLLDIITIETLKEIEKHFTGRNK